MNGNQFCGFPQYVLMHNSCDKHIPWYIITLRLIFVLSLCILFPFENNLSPSRVIPLYKKGGRGEVGNYRPNDNK